MSHTLHKKQIEAQKLYEIRLPSIHFKYNSTAFDTLEVVSFYDSAYQIPDKAVIWLSGVLKDNPSIIIELSAHCSQNETNTIRLSQLRAERVKADLEKLGIPAGRLVAKGYSTLRLLIKPEVIAAAKTAKEKEALHAKNRRCVFKVLSWDYEPAKRTEH